MAWAAKARMGVVTDMRLLPVGGLLLLLAGCQSAPERGLPAPTTLELRGEALLQEGHAEEARAVFMQAAQAGPQPFLACIGLARSAVALSDNLLFENAMHEALRLCPRTPEALELAARTLLLGAKASKGEMQRQRALLAGALIGQARNLAPDLPGLTYHMGLAELLAGRYEVALPLLESAQRMDPESIETVDSLVLVLKVYRRPRAIRDLLEPYEKAGRLSPSLAAELEKARAELAAAPAAGAPGTAPAGRD